MALYLGKAFLKKVFFSRGIEPREEGAFSLSDPLNEAEVDLNNENSWSFCHAELC